MAMMTSTEKQKNFIERMAVDSPFYMLFEHLPGISFFAKNLDYELVCANSAFLERVGLKSEVEVIGKTDYELFPTSLAVRFRSDDEWVITQGKPKLHIVELFINTDGLPGWYLTNKLPILDHEGNIMGLMGTAQNYQYDKKFIQPYLQIEPAIHYIRENFRDSISVQKVADQVQMSIRQLERKFSDTLKMSPREFITKLRLKTACEMLTEGKEPILNIAISLGYYDQSSFTLQFRQHMGITPLQYRKDRQANGSQ